MPLANQLIGILGAVLAVVLASIFTGLGVYIVDQMGVQANISILSTLSQTLGNWGETWYPIILIATAASIIVGLLIHGFGK